MRTADLSFLYMLILLLWTLYRCPTCCFSLNFHFDFLIRIDFTALKAAWTHRTMEPNSCLSIKCVPRRSLQVSLSKSLPPLQFSPAAERHVRSFVYLWNFTHLRPKVSNMTLHCVHASTMAWALEKLKWKVDGVCVRQVENISKPMSSRFNNLKCPVSKFFKYHLCCTLISLTY